MHRSLARALALSLALSGLGTLTAAQRRAPLTEPTASPQTRSAPDFDRFGGGGGPGGDFDWVVPSGQTLYLDTAGGIVLGGPGGAPTTTQTVKRGHLFVRNFTIQPGAVLRVQGAFPLRIAASGDVSIRGQLVADGFDAKDVLTLNTGNVPEPGGAGGPGGGHGGFSSSVTTGSTPAGDPGRGPILGQLGGGGGESAYAPASLGKDARRPGGGGGGRFTADFDPTRQGLFAGAGFPGAITGTGALSGTAPAVGGSPGVGPFVDGDPTNDFYGIRAQRDPMSGLVQLVRGELDHLQGGFGGGGGGDAIPSSVFPSTGWTPGHDEKGGPGGGAGGAVHIRALGSITFGHLGRISVRGVQGGLGENTLFLDHVGGTGGSGSGGMIVLETATRIDFTDGDPAGAPLRTYLDARGGASRIGPKNGVPQGISHGGSGGPGLIQLHLPLRGQTPSFTDPNAMLVLPTAAMSSSNPLEDVSLPPAIELLPGVDG